MRDQFSALDSDVENGGFGFEVGGGIHFECPMFDLETTIAHGRFETVCFHTDEVEWDIFGIDLGGDEPYSSCFRVRHWLDLFDENGVFGPAGTHLDGSDANGGGGMVNVQVLFEGLSRKPLSRTRAR